MVARGDPAEVRRNVIPDYVPEEEEEEDEE